MKEKIFAALTSPASEEMGITDVRIDEIIRSNVPYMKWRRPDISFMHNNRKVVIELQKKSHDIDTIVDRDVFFRLNDIQIIWVFGSDSDSSYDYMRKLNYKNSELTDKIGAMVDSDALMIPVDQMKQTSLMVSDSVSEVRQLAEDVKGSVDDVRNSSEELKTSVKATMDNAILTMRRENREIAEHLEYIRSTVDNIKTPSEEDEALKAEEEEKRLAAEKEKEVQQIRRSKRTGGGIATNYWGCPLSCSEST